MWLHEIEADRLRNLKAVSLSLPAGLTLISGRNGQGKSTLLEAVYLLATGRSFRTRKQDDLVSWSGGPMRVAGVVSSRLGRSRLGVVQDDGRRLLLLDDNETEHEVFIGNLAVVDLTAERMQVVRGSPEERRRFLDRGIVGMDPGYLRILGEYRRVLQQRNALLRTEQSRDRTLVASWDERLVQIAGQLNRRRREYTVKLSGQLGEATRTLFPGEHEVVISYRPSPADTRSLEPGEFADAYGAALSRGFDRDRALGHTLLGPHRDDLLVALDGVDLRRFGSAGQVRAAMVALKLGKLSLLREERGEAPLFLMDDFDTDLDEVRAAALAGFLDRGGFQAIVATSKEGMASRLGVSFARVRMDDGVAEADKKAGPPVAASRST